MRFIPLLPLLLACDPADEAGSDAALGCVEADLIAQCPAGSNPLLGAQAEATCAAAAGGVVEDAEGSATGQCYGVGSCRVVCQFAVPCRCGVQSVGREGVVCASCEDAAACGNDVCEGGESPESCPIDCGAECAAGERRCDGEVLQECSLQGRFDTLPCPAGEVCEFAGGSAQCVRDPGVIESPDAGLGDAGAVEPDGRILPGEGTWPAVPDRRAPATPAPTRITLEVPLDLGPEGQPTELGLAVTRMGRPAVWRRVPAGFEGVGPRARVVISPEGALLQNTQHAEPLGAGPFELHETTAFFADGPSLVSLGLDEGQVRRTAALGGFVFEGAVAQVAVAAGGDEAAMVARSGPDRVLIHWERGSDTRTGRLPRSGANFFTVALAPGVAAASMFDADDAAIHRNLVLWNLAEEQRIFSILPPRGGTWHFPGTMRPALLAMSPDGRTLAAGVADTQIELWDLVDREKRHTLAFDPGNRPILLRFSPDGATLVVAHDEPALINLWRVAGGERVATIDLPGVPEYLGFEPDGHLLLRVGDRLVGVGP